MGTTSLMIESQCFTWNDERSNCIIELKDGNKHVVYLSI